MRVMTVSSPRLILVARVCVHAFERVKQTLKTVTNRHSEIASPPSRPHYAARSARVGGTGRVHLPGRNELHHFVRKHR
jgi:hypothetical protein